MLSMAKVKQARSAELGQGYLDDAVAFVPMIAMLVIRSCESHTVGAAYQSVSDAWHGKALCQDNHNDRPAKNCPVLLPP